MKMVSVVEDKFATEMKQFIPKMLSWSELTPQQEKEM
jgi:hypothetical protein